jgi:hypothetical protein
MAGRSSKSSGAVSAGPNARNATTRKPAATQAVPSGAARDVLGDVLRGDGARRRGMRELLLMDAYDDDDDGHRAARSRSGPVRSRKE